MRGGRWAVTIGVALLAAGCAAHRAYRQGQSEARQGNWDLAVARLTKAHEKDPDNISYKIALENARVRASRYHYDEAKKHMAAEELDKAADELDIASKYDPSNKLAADDLFAVKDRIRQREEDKQRLSDYEAMRGRAQVQAPVPVLSPRSSVPISLKFSDTSLQKVFETLGKLTGVNVILDPDFRDKRVDVNLANVTFQEALDQLTLVNKLFYKVLDQNTLIVVPEDRQHRTKYDEQLVRTFYLQNAETDEVVNLVRNLAGITKVAANKTLGSITVLATPDRMAIAARIIENNDKAKGEVMVEVEILEVNRQKMKQWGIALSNYSASLTLSPTGAPGELTTDPTTGGSVLNVRAQLLSSLNMADYVVTIPSTIFAQFLQTNSTGRLLASPRLRAAEGKKTELKIVSQVPVPTTTFQATNTGGSTFTPVSSVQYKDVGVTLALTPKINPAGDIQLEMQAEFSLQGASQSVGNGQTLPTFLTRNLNGILRLRDGQTSLIGGLIQGAETSNFTGPLGFDSIPLLGKLFGSHGKNTSDSEILISITPHIVRAPKVTEADLKPLLVGTEEAPKVPGARPPLFGAGAGEPSPSPAPTAAPSPAGGSSTPAPPASAPPGSAVPVAAPAATPAPASGAAVHFVPGQASVKVGEQGKLSLVLMGAKDIVSVDLAMAYDGAALEISDAVPGAVLSLDGSSVGVERQIEAGHVHARLVRQQPVAGSGAIVNITFRGLRPGPTDVSVESLTLTTSEGPQALAVVPVRVVVMP